MNCPLCGSEKTPVCFARLDMAIRRCGACGMMFQGPDSAARGDRALIEGIYREYVGHPEQHSLNRLAACWNFSAGRLRDEILEMGPVGTLGSLLGRERITGPAAALCRESAGRLFLAGRASSGKFAPAFLRVLRRRHNHGHLEHGRAAGLRRRPPRPEAGGKVYGGPHHALLGFKGRPVARCTAGLSTNPSTPRFSPNAPLNSSFARLRRLSSSGQRSALRA